ncbi:MAG: beta-lactamase family protein [Phenylobacterium sp.]|uniref:serine hydrolase domain-containing protein n=1 Tax=Phenylobacterium sp. TaxID=1871053 RepID=UPI001A529CAF|nr:serine hydrolase domain-containing protein [Phenylobacterium sp.]MBL8553761.1 beta-lactamase family protein [Phenylobacterium sp.]
MAGVRTFARVVAACAAVLAGAAAVAQPATPAPAPGPAMGRAPPPLAAGQPIPPAELAAYVDGMVERAILRDHIAGVTVSVVQDGQVVFKRGYGLASLKPAQAVDPDRTLFRIGSISKTFTWISIMRQVEAGRMRLDVPVDTYLPPSLRTGNGAFGRPIRVSDLMNHAPGFEDHVFGMLFEHEPRDVRALDTWLAEERPRQVRPPGSLISYSNYGAALAGSAVSHASGRPFEELVEGTILEPLAMSHTTFREPRAPQVGLALPMPAALVPDVSRAFHWNGTTLEQRPYEYIGQIAPAGSASSTAGDMARYMLMLLNDGELDGARIYGPVAAEAFRTADTPAPAGRALRHGFFDQALPGGYVGYGHDGGTMSFFSHMTVVPALRLGVFISTNTDTGARLQADLAPGIVGRFYAARDPFPPAPDPRLARYADAYEGRYLQSRRAMSGLEGFVHRIAFGTDATVTREGYLLLGGLLGANAYAPVGDPAKGAFVSVSDGAPLQFEMKDGRAVGAPLGAASLERVGPLDSPGPLALLSGLTALASVLTLVGLGFRPRHAPAGRWQLWAGRAQIVQALLWLGALLAFATFMQGAADPGSIVFNWPSPTLMASSAMALAASVLAVFSLAPVAMAWREAGWSWRRKAATTLTALLSLALALLLLRWGFLAPWR